jgi:hypothetical protein
MIKSKVGYLCLNCGHLEEHGHHEAKPTAAKKTPVKKPAVHHSSAATRTVSDIKRKSHPAK